MAVRIILGSLDTSLMQGDRSTTIRRVWMDAERRRGREDLLVRILRLRELLKNAKLESSHIRRLKC